MKQSKYNIWLDVEFNPSNDKVKLCYNCTTGGFAEFDKHKLELLENSTSENLSSENEIMLTLDESDKEIYNELVKGGFLVDDNFNYAESSQLDFLATTYRFDSLILTILPTLFCNCNCTYCYENNKKIRMSNLVEEAIINYVEIVIKNNKIKGFYVNWYGGEPLLEYDLIVRLSEKFLDICKKNGVSYAAEMISNCLLLSKDKAVNLKSLGVNKIQVSYDGPKNLHNKKRISLNNEGTFDAITQNILNCLGIIPFSVRVNIDKEAMENIDQLFVDLRPLANKQGLGLYPGRISSTVTTTCANIENQCVDVKEFARFFPYFYEKAIQSGFALSWYPTPRIGGCCATSPSAMVVQPDGNLCRCWSQVGEEKEAFGNILNKAILTKPENYYKWIYFNPYHDENCVDCKYFPLCKSGCPASNITATTDYMSRNVKADKCSVSKYNINEMLLLTYKVKKNQKKNEPGLEIIPPTAHNTSQAK